MQSSNAELLVLAQEKLKTQPSPGEPTKAYLIIEAPCCSDGVSDGSDGHLPSSERARQRLLSRRARKVHRWLVPIAALPLQITAGTGSLDSLLFQEHID